MNRLDKKVAIISGAARGQGAAEARLFAAEGAKVVIGDVREAAVEKLAAELNDKFDSKVAAALKLDVTRMSDWQKTVDTAKREFGGLNVLVNNAGILNQSGVEQTTEEEWDRIIAVNQKGVWLGMKAVVSAMRERGGGSIVNISSIYGAIGSGGFAAYHSTKGAVRVLTKTAAVEYAPYNIRVNSVHPGIIETPMIQEVVTKDMYDMTVAMTPMKRGGKPEEVAWVVLFLATDEASYVTGSEYFVDGGYTAV